MARLGEILVQLELISEDQLHTALSAQVIYGARLGTNLIEMGHLTLDGLAKALARRHRIPAALAGHFDRCDAVIQQRVPADVAGKWRAVPVGRLAHDSRRIAVAVRDPLPDHARAELAYHLDVDPKELVQAVAPELRIHYHLELAYQIPRANRFLRIKSRVPTDLPVPPDDVEETDVGGWRFQQETGLMRQGLPPEERSGETRAARPANSSEAAGPPSRPPQARTTTSSATARTPSSASSPSLSAAAERAIARTSTGVDVPRTSTAVDLPRTSTGVDLPRTSTGVDLPRTSTAADLPRTSTATDLPRTSTATDLPRTSTATDLPRTSTATDLRRRTSSASDDAAGCDESIELSVGSDPALRLDYQSQPLVPPVQRTIERERRSFVPSLGEDKNTQTLARIAVRQVASESQIRSIRELPARPSSLEDLARIVRRSETRDKVGEIIITALAELPGAPLDAAAILVVRPPLAIGWKGFCEEGAAAIESLAVPLDQPSLVAETYQAGSARVVEVDPTCVAVVDERMWTLLGSRRPNRVAVAPICVADRVICVLYAQSRAALGPAEAMVTILAEAAGTAFGRLLRAAQR